jgi:hypothetical protein
VLTGFSHILKEAATLDAAVASSRHTRHCSGFATYHTLDAAAARSRHARCSEFATYTRRRCSSLLSLSLSSSRHTLDAAVALSSLSLSLVRDIRAVASSH